MKSVGLEEGTDLCGMGLRYCMARWERGWEGAIPTYFLSLSLALGLPPAIQPNTEVPPDLEALLGGFPGATSMTSAAGAGRRLGIQPPGPPGGGGGGIGPPPRPAGWKPGGRAPPGNMGGK